MKHSFILLVIFIHCFGFSAYSAEYSPVVKTGHREQYLIDKDSVDILLEKAEKLYQDGQLIKARDIYQDILTTSHSGSFSRDEIQKKLEALNLKIIFSRIETKDSEFYTVQPGDSLFKIARKFETTVELLKKSNGLSSSTIYPGDRLKVIRSRFSVFIDKSDNSLELRLDDRVIKHYPVATGTDNSTPVGEFMIKDKLVNPTWYRAGAVVPPDSPENILGSRWMGFDLRGYGIHGTTLPETIGSHSTAGCIRMFDQDAEELYSLIPVGTKVVVVD